MPNPKKPADAGVTILNNQDASLFVCGLFAEVFLPGTQIAKAVREQCHTRAQELTRTGLSNMFQVKPAQTQTTKNLRFNPQTGAYEE